MKIQKKFWILMALYLIYLGVMYILIIVAITRLYDSIIIPKL